MTRVIRLNGHLRGPVTLTPIVERLAVELPLFDFYDLGLSQLGFKHPNFHLQSQRSYQIRHRRGAKERKYL